MSREKYIDNTIGINWYLNNPDITNCGSYAFNILNWYNPWPKRQSAAELIDMQLAPDHRNLQSLKRNIMRICSKKILEDFKSKNIKQISSPKFYKPNKDLIAFRIAVAPGDWDNCTETDFHFRVFRDGYWSEKSGSEREIHFCDFTEDTWFTATDLAYDSPIMYFIKDS